jgi:hypothetical protein
VHNCHRGKLVPVAGLETPNMPLMRLLVTRSDSVGPWPLTHGNSWYAAELPPCHLSAGAVSGGVCISGGRCIQWQDSIQQCCSCCG